ncbi:amino acid transporter heavy chain SLC3A2 isoform X1 [Salvelinus sp. IW2-2015]|uniref:amino acid transporter heavy chain SLC3A2 isoform X1 n=2 Tax=Salvelinus sp. IW2-2015 TaxID=2691554 RepID=UPI000CDF6EBB|nr:4F2 cell-surface antigen heavy chain isoform X1 [Salvelinus alpinus]
MSRSSRIGMPLNMDGGYGSTAVGSGMSGSVGGSETVPLLITDPEPETPKWQPMSKEQLELEAGGPGWRKIRSRLMVFFWLGWLALLGASIAIIVQSPRPVAPTLLWWQSALFYRIQPILLMDAQNEVPGGIDVACEQLPYLKSLGVKALILEGLFHQDASPLDLRKIDERVGTVPQIQQLLMESHNAGIKVVFDFCDLDLFGPKDSVGNDSAVPSDLTGSIQYALRFWLEQGVAGFGICDTDAAYSEKTLTEWRDLVKEFSTSDDERIVVVKQTGESLPALNTSSTSVNSSLVELVMMSLLPHEHHLLSGQEVAIAVERHLSTSHGELWPSWTVGGEASPMLHRILLVLMMTLPGSPVVKYGEEIVNSPNVSADMSWEREADKTNGLNDSVGEQRKLKRSALALFSSLSGSRLREESLLYGSFTFLPFNTTSLPPYSSNSTLSPPSTPVLAFLRSWGCVHFLVLLNLGPEAQALDPAWAPSLPTAGVFVTSTGMNRLGGTSLETLRLQPEEAIVIKLFESGSYAS